MNKLEKDSFRNALSSVSERVLSDFNWMMGKSKATKKALHKQRMQAFQNNAFSKGKKNGK